MKDRLKKLRKALDLTQTEFAERIGTVQNTITGYENGRRNPSGPVVSAICKEFGVNEDWLRNGTGEMFAPTSGDELEALVNKYNLDQTIRVFIEKLITLPERDRAVVSRLLLETAAGIETMKAAGADPAEDDLPDPAEMSIDEKVEAYRRALEDEAATGGKGEQSEVS